MSNTNQKIFDAILRINSDARLILTGNNLEEAQMDWDAGTTPISKEDIQTEMDKE